MTRVTQRQLIAYDRFIAKGLHEKGAAAPTGNFVQESGENLDSTMFRAHPDASGGVAQPLKSGGIAEWLGDRKTAYITFSRAAEASRNMPGGSLLNDLETQCDFVIHELQQPQYAGLYRQLTTETVDHLGNPRSVATLTANFCWEYERPSPQYANLNNRIEHAEAVYERAQLIKAAEGQPTPIPVPQLAPTAPIPQVTLPQAPLPVPPAPTAPAGPPISASTAGRQAAVLDNLLALRANYLAERASIDAEIAIVDATITDFSRLGPVPAIDAPRALPKPNEQQPGLNPVITPQKRTQTMFGKSWITSVFGVGSIGAAVASVSVDLANKQMPDWATIMLIISSISNGTGLLNAKDKNVTGGTISAVTGVTLNQPVSIVDDGMGGRVPSSNSRVGPDGRFIR